MTRPPLLLFVLLVPSMFSGCSKPEESPRFVPATLGNSKASSLDRQKPVRPVEPPIKIDMH